MYTLAPPPGCSPLRPTDSPQLFRLPTFLPEGNLALIFSAVTTTNFFQSLFGDLLTQKIQQRTFDSPALSQNRSYLDPPNPHVCGLHMIRSVNPTHCAIWSPFSQ